MASRTGSASNRICVSQRRVWVVMHRATVFWLIACMLLLQIGAAEDDLHIHVQTRLHQPRPKLLAFVGVQTGFKSAQRRQLLRKTWFPGSREALDEYAECTQPCLSPHPLYNQIAAPAQAAAPLCHWLQSGS